MQYLKKFTNCICCIDEAKYPDPYNFTFHGNDKNDQNELLFQSNFVRTSKYTIFTFLPKGLLIQFKRLANVYFLVIAVLQSIPSISPLNAYTAWIPLLIVLSISMLRQGYEDYQRYKSDRQQNYQTLTYVRRNGKFEQIQWSKVVVGDICKAEQNDLFPADLILLTSSSEGGVAFIQTASLDGQKNLKPRNSIKQTIKYQQQTQLNNLKGQWEGTIPDKQLHKFSSQLHINGQTIVYEGDKQLLYRGTRLKNTKWVYGLVIYTGKNTKIMLNSQSQSAKLSQIEIKVNYILGIILAVQVVWSFILAILHGVFRNNNQQKHALYIQWSTANIAADAVLIFFTYFVLINTMIPISLVVSIEVVKFTQSIFINRDKLMYSQIRQRGSEVKSASLNQQLGQIQYVFSDKTGTLTMNIMQFKIAVIGDHMYGDLGLISSDPNAQKQQQQGFHDDKLTQLLNSNNKAEQCTPITVKNKQQTQSLTFSDRKSLAQQYLKILALAHEVVVQIEKGQKVYQGPSPDEITLVNAAKSMKIQFIKSTQSTATIQIRGLSKTYQLLELYPFTSDRKRMSVIIRQNNMIKMLTKGADNIIKQRLAPGQPLNLDQQLNKFSTIGLRTLLIAQRIISQQQYKLYKQSLKRLPPTNRQNAFNELVSKLQQNLYLIGATAVLDRLQDDVPETIRDLIRANIKVWMLTGDKMQTAENIAKSCNLIQPHFQILKYQLPAQQQQKMHKTTNIFAGNQNHSEVFKTHTAPSNILKNASKLYPPVQQVLSYLKTLVARSQDLTKLNIAKALLVQGSDLGAMIKYQQCHVQLANLAKNCQAVVCCRLLPSQKADVVRIIRQQLNKITLSIGDGANDIPMIKTAHIGVGLCGEEGKGAEQASDYALPEFRMLWRLLFIHGRWNYIRISQMILYFFYKNMLFTIPQIIIAFFNGYSGQTMFDDYYIALYNLMFTSLPLIIRAVFEQDVNYVYKDDSPVNNRTSAYLISNPVLKKQNNYLPPGYHINKYFYRLFPKIYFIGQQNLVFNYFNYFAWVIEGIAQSILITLFTIFIIGSVSLNQLGIQSDWWIVGITIFSSVILVVTFKLASHTKFYSVAFVFIVFFSLGLYGAYTWISNYFLTDNILGTAFIAWTTGQTYFLVLFCTCLILAIDGSVIFSDFDNGGYASKMRQVIREQQQGNKNYYDEVSLRLSDNLSVNPRMQQQSQ